MKKIEEYRKHLAQNLAKFKDIKSQELAAIRNHHRQKVYNKELASYEDVLVAFNEAVKSDLEEYNNILLQQEQKLEPYKDKPVLLEMMKKVMGKGFRPECRSTRMAVVAGNCVIQSFGVLDVPLLELPS